MHRNASHSKTHTWGRWGPWCRWGLRRSPWDRRNPRGRGPERLRGHGAAGSAIGGSRAASGCGASQRAGGGGSCNTSKSRPAPRNTPRTLEDQPHRQRNRFHSSGFGSGVVTIHFAGRRGAFLPPVGKRRRVLLYADGGRSKCSLAVSNLRIVHGRPGVRSAGFVPEKRRPRLESGGSAMVRRIMSGPRNQASQSKKATEKRNIVKTRALGAMFRAQIRLIKLRDGHGRSSYST